MQEPSIKITYDAFQYNKGVEDLSDIEIFKEDLAKSYSSSIVKARPAGRGGGAYQFIVESFINLHAKDYLEIIGGYLGKKIIDKAIGEPLLNRYVFAPFKSAYEKLKSQNAILGCYLFTIELLDTKIFIYSIYPDSTIEYKDEILFELDRQFNNLIIEGEFPSEIHIPVFNEILNEKIIYRPPLGMAETLSTADSHNYLKLWGLKYQYSFRSIVYDVVNQTMLNDSPFMNEDEFFQYKRQLKNR
jgi:hypothetical protein